MAERRMFSKSVVESARFLKMPPSSQNLYFHLGLNADDDGVVEAYSVLNLIRANEDDLRVLVSKEFVEVLNEDLVAYISDWRKQNVIRADRKKDSVYTDLLLQLHPDVDLLEKRDRSDRLRITGQSQDRPRTAQCSVVKDSIVEDSIVEGSAVIVDTHSEKYRLDNEVLTISEYESLVSQFSEEVVDSVVSRILTKPYHGCLNVNRIFAWCSEQVCDVSIPAQISKESKHSEQLMKLAKERR
ncbi:MAG: hypothetical protein HUJ72_09445 [Blautia sp.]|nr:hypothetical protein [Blautia sp.]